MYIVLIGVDVFASCLLQGRLSGPPNTPTAVETHFGWVLAGQTGHEGNHSNVAITHVTTIFGTDDLLKKFWDVERSQSPEHTVLTSEEKSVTKHYQKNHYRDESGMFIVPLPKRDDA